MTKYFSKRTIDIASQMLDRFLPWMVFILGVWFVVIKPLGVHWSLVPGDQGDARFNNYILEHFFRWLSGLDHDFWNAAFFYPYQNVTAFSDNLLGSAVFYAVLRWLTLERETAYQGWYVFSFFLNYAAAVYVLSRFRFHSLAITFGAFFFTFGLPVLAQENHAQLAYRFGIPLACYFLWQFFEHPRVHYFLSILFWTIWQFYCSIYLGVFLVLVLIAQTILMPLFSPETIYWGYLISWPKKIWHSLVQTNWTQKVISLVLLGAGLACLWLLLAPYYKVSIDYGFVRKWKTVSSMLPVWQSYLLADNSLFWSPISNNITGVRVRWEHQLFPGISLVVMTAIGLIFRFRTKNGRVAWLMFWVGVILIVLTIKLNDFSFYQFVWKIKGINSIRAVTRIALVFMWPQAYFASWSLDGIIQSSQKKINWQLAFILGMTGLLLAESIFYTHSTYSKMESIARIEKLMRQIPSDLPEEPVISVAFTGNQPDFVRELDVMLMTQELGYPTMNGYSGNFPPGYDLPEYCYQIVGQLKSYSRTLTKNREEQYRYYLETIKHVVLIGYNDCLSVWWRHVP